MGIKDIYYSYEEKWYKALDKIDSKLPIYKVIDPIDSVVPSFLLFLIIIAVVLLFIVGNLWFSILTYSAEFTILTSTGTQVDDTLISLQLVNPDGSLGDIIKQRTNAEGIVTFAGLARNSEIMLDINLTRGIYKGNFVVSNDIKESIILEEKIILKPIERTIILKSQFGNTITEALEVEFYCENSSVTPEPRIATLSNGRVSVTEPLNCFTLYAKVNSEEYSREPFAVNTNPFTYNLRPYEPPTVPFTIKIRNEDGVPISGNNFKVTMDGKRAYQKTSTSSEILVDAASGEYFLSLSDLDNDYAIVSRNVTVEASGGSVEIKVSKTIKARINVEVVDESSGLAIEEAIVNLKQNGREIDSRKTDEDGEVQFGIVDVGNYSISAKKPGDTNGGYFVKTIDLENVESDIDVLFELTKITNANAGKTRVIVVDQDNEIVSNARVFLKYSADDTLVELNNNKNYVFSDINGEATLLAGNIEERVYAQALKYPSSGVSSSKVLRIDEENEFTIEMEIGNTEINLNVKDELGEPIDAEAKVYTINDKEISGLLSIENGNVSTLVKSGRVAYIKVESEDFVTYYTEPVFLWPDKEENFEIIMKKEVVEPAISFEGIYNTSGQVVRTMESGKKYYALLTIESEDEIDDLLMHFRAGKEELLENDYLIIEDVEAVGLSRTIKGTSYTSDYDRDNDNLTDSIAKWVNAEWNNFKGIMRVKVNFKLKENTPASKELQFFYRAEFDNDRKPVSEPEEDLYADTYSTNIFFAGVEAICESDFCIMSEWLYDEADELYINPPFVTKQVNEYTYNFQIVNNSSTDYGTEDKRIYLNLDLLGEDGQGIKINEYTIRDTKNTISGEDLKSISNLEIENFEKNTAINIELKIEGVATGNSSIRTQLKSDGVIIFTDEEGFSVPSEEELQVSLSRNFLPALLDSEIIVEVKDSSGEVINEAEVAIYSKEVGYEEQLVDSDITNRFGKATLRSGAQFTTTQVIVDVSKAGYARERIALGVRDSIVAFNPPTLNIDLDTVTNREAIESIEIGNGIDKDLEIFEIKAVADFEGVINEGALQSYFDTLDGTMLEKDDVTELDLIRIRLDNGVTLENFIEPVNLDGSVVLTLKVEGTNIIYDAALPFNLRVASESEAEETGCLLVNYTSPQSKVTEKGRVIYTFEMVNGCSADDVGVPIENIKVKSNGQLFGSAELSLLSTTSTKGGRTALDGRERIVINSIAPGEKLVGTVLYTPQAEAAGQEIKLSLDISGNYIGTNVRTNPKSLDFTTSVVNLKECMSISSDSGIVAFDEEANVTIDATSCLGQKVDVMLCRNDPGCSGGAPEGKVTLSKKNFSLTNESENISVYSPTLPGSYGVSVWARVGAQGSHSYIGEVPVNFRETEEKFFELSKYEINVMGNGSEDVILLRNKMLTQDVLVEADNCVWGVQEPDTDWMQVIGGAMMGATLGNMITSNLKGGSEGEGSSDRESPARENLSEKDQSAAAKNEMNAEAALTDVGIEMSEISSISPEDMTIQGKDGITYSAEVANPDNGALRITSSGDGGEYIISQPTPDTAQFTRSTGDFTEIITFNGSTGQATRTVLGPGSTASGDSYQIQINQTMQSTTAGFSNNTDITFHNNDTGKDFLYNTSPGAPGLTMDVIDSTTSSFGTESVVYSNSWDRAIDWITPNFISAAGDQHSFGWQNDIPPTINQTTPNPNTDSFGWQNDIPPTINQTTPNPNTGRISGSETDFEINKNKISFSGISFPGADVINKNINNAPKISFGALGLSGNTWGTILGAVAGALAAYQLQDWDCADETQTATYTDYAIFLTGEKISVTSPDGSIKEERDVPSDAGDLVFTLGGVSPSWDFTNADYSTVENVGIKFTNTGLNEPTAQYGVLTINATTHKHGKQVSLDNDTSVSDRADVYCNNANFGEFWIGAEEEAGSCTGISEGAHSQKYHIRVQSAEPKGEEAYLEKANVCYNGVLTGATGNDAVPRVQLNWDWDSVDADTCAYGNPNYVYCDATQFSISLVKRIAELDEFFSVNQNYNCPDDPILNDVIASYEELNSVVEIVPSGFIGASEVEVSVIDDVAYATITVENNTGGSIETNASYSWKGEGTPDSDTLTQTFPEGTSTFGLSAGIPKYDGVYFFTIVFNGPSGSRRALTEVFRNEPYDQACWADRTTRAQGGVPAVTYYLADQDFAPVGDVQTGSDLYGKINFGAYLMRDAYTPEFFRDFSTYYLDTFLSGINDDEKRVLEYMKEGKLKITKRFSGQERIEAGLYDVWLNIDFGEGDFMITGNDGSEVDASLLLIKSPSENSPFYNIPFNGSVGVNGRQGYGATYNNENEEIIINDDTRLNSTPRTFQNSTGNGMVDVTTSYERSFEKLNSSPGTRGQLATISYNGNTASIVMSPNYATPIIGRYTSETGDNTMRYLVEENGVPLRTGGNLLYWTGAAKSRNLYGGAAIDTFYNSPDYLLETGENYGFTWEDVTQNNTLYLKTVIYSPTNNRYMLVSENGRTSFWSANSNFSLRAELKGINGMTYNSADGGTQLSSIEDLFNMVRNQDVCVSNDGSITSFWWNPRVISTEKGSVDSLENYEINLVGSS